MADIGKKVWNWFEKILKIIITGLLKIIGKSIIEEQWNTFMQFVKFAFVGVSNFMISYVAYAVLIAFHVYWLIASIVGFVISVLNSFYWNNKYVFALGKNQTRSTLQALTKTFLSYAFSGLILANMLLFFWNDILHINPLIGPIINLIITTPINFVINKIWAFKTKHDIQEI